MFFKLKSFILFISKSTNQHGVHSPFVYNLVTKCFYVKNEKSLVLQFKKYKKVLLNSKKTLVVTDFGAGSKLFKNNTRKVSKIAKYAGISNKRAALLIKLTRYFKPKTILEIGTSLGLGTTALHLGNPQATISTLEGCNQTASVAKEGWDNFQFKSINLKIGNFKDTLPKIVANKQFDLIYFDGNHQKDATIHYFETCLVAAHNNSVFIFDDIHWSPQMELAWEYIKKHPSVKVTIDTYQWGLVFFRNEQEKEHFVIRV